LLKKAITYTKFKNKANKKNSRFRRRYANI